MIYTAQEVADKLHISKVTVYKKLKLPKFSDKTILQNEQIMIDDSLLELINDSLQVKADLTDNNEAAADTLETGEVQVNNDVLTAYKLLTDTLINQLAEKDNQMNEKDNQIASLIKLSENFQVLQKGKPPENILQLEEHFQDLDTKLQEVKENMIERKEQQQNKGFFSKIFKK
jgi:hypothetical protein